MGNTKKKIKLLVRRHVDCFILVLETKQYRNRTIIIYTTSSNESENKV